MPRNLQNLSIAVGILCRKAGEHLDELKRNGTAGDLDDAVEEFTTAAEEYAALARDVRRAIAPVSLAGDALLELLTTERVAQFLDAVFDPEGINAEALKHLDAFLEAIKPDPLKSEGGT